QHVLCEKLPAINANEAYEISSAARAKGVFSQSFPVWTRFFPLITDLQHFIHIEKTIGDVHRVFCDFSLAMDMPSLLRYAMYDVTRLKDPALGAGALLDIGIYSLTYGYLILDPNIGTRAASRTIQSSMTIVDGIDHMDTIILNYPDQRSTAILTASLNNRTPEAFCRTEGSKGVIVISGYAALNPARLVISKPSEEDVIKDYSKLGIGFYFKADAVALDLAAGRTESEVMPLDKTIRIIKTINELRKAHGVKYPQDT
ncbi:hypothetical protein AOQ84DRAFT_413622, partial [Glonium stellatum]